MPSLEIIDIIDIETDTVIGQAEKSRIYNEFLPHRIVHIFIYNNDGQILLQKRAATLSYCPNHWATAACGHVTSGEDYLAAGNRELHDEIGINIPLTFVAAPIYATTDRMYFKKRLGVLTGIYEGLFKTSESEVSEVRWFSPGEIDTLVEKNELMHPEFSFLWKNFRTPIFKNRCLET
jgi:isopentenyl-diphosphate delta-isomerase